MPSSYDWLVVTAASSTQAHAYRAQLASRRESGALGGFSNILVVPDPHDRRAGSGGSTLIALVEIIRRRFAGGRGRGTRGAARSIESFLRDTRILIIHSGGDSRRLPAYAAQGKVFAPLPMDTSEGRQADLFDLVLADSASIVPPGSGGVLITAGDVLLGLRKEQGQIQRAIDSGSPGVVGVAFRTTPATGARHGVYVLDRKGTVINFLQKPTVQEQTRAGAISPRVESGGSRGRGSEEADAVLRAPHVLVDTGVVHLDPATASAWLAATGLEITRSGPMLSGLLAEIASPGGRPPQIDLYHHVLSALPARATLASYLKAINASEEHREVFTDLFASLRGPRFTGAIMDRCDFLHIGSTRELIQLVTADARFRRAGMPRSSVAIYNSPRFPGGSLAEAPKRRRGKEGLPVRPRAVIEACDIRRISLGGENLVVGIPRQLDGMIHLPRGWGICALPVGVGDWAIVLFADGDDCKTPLERGGTFGNRPLRDLVARGCGEDHLWPREKDGSVAERTLWTARLWEIASPSRSLESVAWMMDPSKLAPSRWPSSPRTSLARLVREVNHGRLIEHRTQLQRADRLARLSERLQADLWLPAAEIAADCRTHEERRAAIACIESLSERSAPIVEARLQRAISELSRGPAARTALARSFDAVSRAVHTDFDLPTAPPRAAILPDQVVWVTTPVRTDLAGGWSDTPPVCNELGGSVVNMAITLNGQFPVQVVARRLDRPVLRLSSVDLGRSITIASSRSARDHHDPQDWAALPKAALVLSGISPSDAGHPLERWLERFGGGLDLTVFSALPKGSGLGTSSVLGAAILACLDRVVGRELDHRSIIRRTSILEQMMSTAGGWQDQCGGITAGIKINRTPPGQDQTPVTTQIPASEEMQGRLASRSLLYYTGYRRLARNILQKVVSRYLSRDREAVAIVHQLKDLAERLAVAIADANVDEYARCVRQNWEFKKRLDPGSTNDAIEAIVRPLERHLAGFEMPGAGGGGFLYLIARDEMSARKVRAMLESRPPNALARVFDFAVDGRGLGVSVL